MITPGFKNQIEGLNLPPDGTRIMKNAPSVMSFVIILI